MLNSRTKKKPKAEKKPKPAAPASPGVVKDEPAPASGPSDLERAVAESRAELAKEEELPSRRGRGRPRKNLEPLETEPESGGDAPDVAEPAQQSGAGGFAPVLRTVAQLPFAARARKTGFDGYRLEPEIAAELANAWDSVAQKYLPAGASDSPLVNAICLTGAVVVAKEIELDQWRQKNAPKPKPEPKPEPAGERKHGAPVFETVDAVIGPSLADQVRGQLDQEATTQ